MDNRSSRVYEFGEFRLECGKRLLLRRDGAPVRVTAKAYDTLVYLVEHFGAVLAKEELMQAVWPDAAVEENNLNQNISILRRVLEDGGSKRRYIATVSGRGYQFVASVVANGAPAPARSGMPSVAVLPFVNVGGNAEYEYFADGLADELISALSKLPGVRVAARTSAFAFKGRQAHVREIASQLGVTLVLEGSVRKSGNRLRVSAQLVNAADGYQVWSERYDREIEMRESVRPCAQQSQTGRSPVRVGSSKWLKPFVSGTILPCRLSPLFAGSAGGNSRDSDKECYTFRHFRSR